MKPRRAGVRTALGVVVTLAWWAAVGAGVQWLLPPLAAQPAQPGYGALFGLFMGAWMLGSSYAEHRGWIRGPFSESRGVQKSREQLARDREQIMQEARAKLN
jgi:hypothetical protein